jgi:hypothetical protein
MTDDPVAEVARAAARRLVPEFGQDVETKTEAALYARDSSRGKEQYDPVSLGILIVTIATLAWMVYSDHRKTEPNASPATVERVLRNEIRREVEVTPDSIRITDVVVQEVMDKHPSSLEIKLTPDTSDSRRLGRRAWHLPADADVRKKRWPEPMRR